MKPNDQEFLSLTLKVIIWQYRWYFLLMYYFRIQEKKKWKYFITQNLCLFSTAKYYLQPKHMKSMGECKKDVTPLLTHWSYIFLALTHRNDRARCSGNHCYGYYPGTLSYSQVTVTHKLKLFETPLLFVVRHVLPVYTVIAGWSP